MISGDQPANYKCYFNYWKGHPFSCALPNLPSASHTYDSLLGPGQATSSFSLLGSSSLKQGNNTFSSVGSINQLMPTQDSRQIKQQLNAKQYYHQLLLVRICISIAVFQWGKQKRIQKVRVIFRKTAFEINLHSYNHSFLHAYFYSLSIFKLSVRFIVIGLSSLWI